MCGVSVLQLAFRCCRHVQKHGISLDRSLVKVHVRSTEMASFGLAAKCYK